MSFTQAQKNVLSAQELQQIEYSQDIQSDPASYQSYLKNNVDQLMNETLGRKRNAFNKSLVDSGRYMDMDHSTQLYKTRSSDVEKLQKVIKDVNTRYEVGIDSTKKITRRQFEINEWAYNNKLETLFLLQLLFISVLILVLFLFLSKSGYISNVFAGGLCVILFLVLGYVIYVRWSYTRSIRDPHMWSRRSFPLEPNGPPQAAGQCNAQGDYVIDVKQFLPDIITKNVSSLDNKVRNVFSDLTNQANMYQTSGAIPNASCPPTSSK